MAKEKLIPCPYCGKKIRACNLTRHRQGQHLPKRRRTVYGARYQVPPMPIRVGRERDRRYDEYVPRGMGPERFRIYRLRAGELELIATTGGPQSVGVALLRLYEEGEYVGDDSAGVLDTATDPGHWIVSPFTLGRRPLEKKSDGSKTS